MKESDQRWLATVRSLDVPSLTFTWNEVTGKVPTSECMSLSHIQKF